METCQHCNQEIEVVGVEVQGVYDGVLFWICPACSGTWHRWPAESSLRELAEPYIHA